MWPWTRRDITPVGMDIDGSAVRLAQIEFLVRTHQLDDSFFWNPVGLLHVEASAG